MGSGGKGSSTPDYSAQMQQYQAQQDASYARQKAADDAKYAKFQADQKAQTEAAARTKSMTAAEADKRTQLAQVEADRKAKEAIDRKYQGELDTAYADRSVHVNQASNDVDALIARERSKANVSGAEYALTAEQRDQRINDQLANYRSATDDQRIMDLASQYGDYAKGKGYSTDFTYKPGAKKKAVATTAVTGTGKTTPGTLLTSDEDLTSKLGIKSILG